jgi:hypothetical protein
MSESIKKSDIITGDPFGEIAKQISEALGYLVKFDNEVKQTAKDLSTLSTASTKTVQGIDAINRAEKESAKLVQDKLRNDKALEKMRLEEIRINKAREKSIDDYNKKAEKEAKIAKDSANAYKVLERATRDQKNESKRLGAELLKLEANGEGSTKAFKKLEAQYKATTAEAQKGDQQLKKLDKTLGDNFRNVGNYEEATVNLKTELRKLTVELQNMAQTDPRFSEMSRRAGELKDQIGDTRGVIEALAGSTTERLGKGLASVGKIGISAFQGIEGAQALLGVKSEKLMEVMVRLQALASLSDALEGLGGLGDKLTEIKAGFKSVGEDIINGTKRMFGFGKATNEAGDAVQETSSRSKKLGGVLKGIGFAAAIGLAIELASVLYDVASGADDAARAVDGMNKAMEEGGKFASERLKKLQDEVGLGKITKQQYQEQIKAEVRLMNAEKARTKEQIKALESSKKYQDALATNPLFRSGADLRVLAQMKSMKESVYSVNEELKAFNSELTAMNIAERQATESTKQSTLATREKTKAVEDLKNTVEDSHLTLEQMHEAELKRLEDEKAALEAVKTLTKELNDEMAGDTSLVEVKPEEFTERQKRSMGVMTDAYKEQLQIAQQFQAALTQIANDEINKRIELSKKEQDAAKSQQDYLQQLAANGNITAQQSITETIEIQRAAQEEQMRLEKQKQNIELISAGLQSFNSSLSAGKTPAAALAETLVSTNVLVGMLKNLNFYEKGTDNAPGGLAVVDEKGAEIITDSKGKIKEVGAGKGPRFTMLDKGDKVYNATKSAAVFDAIANADKMRPMDSAGNSFDLMQLNGSLLNIEKAIKNQPTSSTEWGGILAGVGKVIETKTVGRSRIKNTFEI